MLALILQVWLLADVILDLSRYSPVISALHTAASLAVAVHIASRKDKGVFKTSWIVLVLVLPLFGGVLYALFNFQTSAKKFREEDQHTAEKAKELFALPGEQMKSVIAEMPECTAQVRYLQEYAGFPVYGHTETKYLTPGEQMLEAMIPEIEKADATSSSKPSFWKKVLCGTGFWMS